MTRLCLAVLITATLVACSSAPSDTEIVKETVLAEVPVTVLVTHEIGVEQTIEVTREIEVTRLIEVTRIVEKPVTVTPTSTPINTPTPSDTPTITPTPSNTPTLTPSSTQPPHLICHKRPRSRPLVSLLHQKAAASTRLAKKFWRASGAPPAVAMDATGPGWTPTRTRSETISAAPGEQSTSGQPTMK